jgi:hypothetical protein
MNDNVVSFEDKRLKRLDGTLFGRDEGERTIAHVVSRLELCKSDQALVRTYIETIDSGEVILMPDDGSAASPTALIHLADLLSNYDRLLDEQVAALSCEAEELDGPYQRT